MKILYSLTLIFSINALTFFWSDDENQFFKVKCNPTSPKSDNRDFYSIGSDRLPKRNGSEYVYSARDVADEVFKIVFAQGGNLNLAFGKCSQALVMVGNGSTKPCEKYLSTLQYNDGLQSNLRNNEKYKKPEFQDGFYEECEGDFVSERYTLSNGGYYDNLHEVFDDKTHFIQKKLFMKTIIEFGKKITSHMVYIEMDKNYSMEDLVKLMKLTISEQEKITKVENYMVLMKNIFQTGNFYTD